MFFKFLNRLHVNWGEHHVPDDQMLHEVISDSRDDIQGVDDKVTDVQEAGMGQRLVRHNFYEHVKLIDNQ